MARRINGERVVVLGWTRAILLQIAHPLIAAGVHEHSRFRESPWAAAERLHSTIRAMLALTFGPEDATSRALEGILATTMMAYTSSLYRGGLWKSHIAIQEPYDDRPEFGAAILAEAARTGKQEYSRSVGLPADDSIRSIMVSGSGPSSRIEPARMYWTPCAWQACITPDVSTPRATALAMPPARRTVLIARM